MMSQMKAVAAEQMPLVLRLLGHGVGYHYKSLGPIHSCHKWLWNSSHASRAVLGAGDRAVNQTDKALSSRSLYCSGERQYKNSL